MKLVTMHSWINSNHNLFGIGIGIGLETLA
jgi:hypothetical protein